ncbi:conserved Plasmodium protein, unknown function [Plasmodium vivax]|uniref:Uncharacterized protein n=2 Tax=Plasmodium vivax TaxID=5855 RepID=A0A0J9TRJ0_PLAVI|nr:hypothetical protein PVNG_02667 [Plasmodium vivax North Korean]CAG9473828.1 unnamed protein product [Plasmodium vivax]SCO68938.1 conserved Plasmodium protein, unknown function [Plasmodium vivax]SCO74402.1 conserved Plasmodium protein, unknown function [Plasmodium vivax]
MTLRNDAKSKNAKTSVNNSGVHNSSGGPTSHAAVLDSNPSGSRSSATESREERRNRRSRNAQISAIASSEVDAVGDQQKGKDDGEEVDREAVDHEAVANEVVDNEVQASTTAHVNESASGTHIGDDNADVKCTVESSTCQIGNEKYDVGGDGKDEKEEQHSVIPPQGEDSSIPKEEKTNPMKDQNGEEEHDNPVAQEEVAAIPLKRSRRRPIRNYKYDIFFQEENVRSVAAYSNTEGSNRKKKKVDVQKSLADNTSEPNCEEKKSSILSNEEDKGATNVDVSSSRNEDALVEHTDEPVNVNPPPCLTKNEEVAQKPEHCYCNVLGNDVLAEAAESAAHSVCIPPVSNPTADDNAKEGSATEAAVKSGDNNGDDLSVANQPMWNDPEREENVKVEEEQNAVEVLQEGRTVDLDSSIRGFEKGRSHRGRGKGKAGRGRGRGRDKLMSKKMEYIEQQPFSINNSDLILSEEKKIFPNVTDEGGMVATLPVSEDAHQIVVAPPVEKKKRGRKKKIQNSIAQESALDVSLNENAREHKSAVKPILHDSSRRRRSDVSFDMSNAPGDADTFNLDAFPPRVSSMLQERHLPHLRAPKVDINSSGVHRSYTPARRRVKDEKNKEFLYSGNSPLGVATSAGARPGHVVNPSSGSHHQFSQAAHLDYACGRNAKKRKCSKKGKHGRGRKKSRGRKCTSVNISTHAAGSHKSGAANMFLESEEGFNDGYGHNSSTHGDNDNKRLFPNETFQIKEEFMNNVNSLNTVFNFNDEFLKFLKKISQLDDIDYDVMLPFLGEVQGKLAKDIKQQFSPQSLDSHNVDEAVYAMGYIVDILNNNNEILNKLNQLEYKFYYDYLRKRSCKEGNKQKNYDHKIENEIALNIARIPRDINNECCAKIQSNDLDDDNTVNNESSKSFNEIDDEEERKLNELLYCTNKEMDDTYKIPNCADMYFMNYNEEDDFYHMNERSLNLKNDYATSVLPNASVVGEKPHQGSCEVVGERTLLCHPTSGAQSQVTHSTGEEKQHGGDKAKQGSDANGQPHNPDTFAKDEPGEDSNMEGGKIVSGCSGEVQGGEGPPEVAPKYTEKMDHNAENEKIDKKINEQQNEKNVNKNDPQFKHPHKMTQQNNVDFVCDELNKLIKHTLKNEDLFYSNYSQGRYKNVNEESLFKHYISTKLYKSTNLVDRYREEQKERSFPSHRGFRGRPLGANEGVSRKVDELEKTLMQSYADYFRRLNDFSSRGRTGEGGKGRSGGSGGSGTCGRSGPSQLGHSTDNQLEAHPDATSAVLPHTDDNMEKQCADHEERSSPSPCWDAKKDPVVGRPKWEDNFNQNGGGNDHWKERHLSNNSNNISIVSSTIGEISYGVSALSSEETTPVKEKLPEEPDDNTNSVSANLQGNVKTEPMDREEKPQRGNDHSEEKQPNNCLNSEERLHDGPKGADPQRGGILKEEAQKDEPEKKTFGFASIIPFFKKSVKENEPVGNNNPDGAEGADHANHADNACDHAKQGGDRLLKETEAEFETQPSGGVGATEKGPADGKPKIDGEKDNASIRTHDEETKVCAPFEGSSNSLDISNRSEKDKAGKATTDVSLRPCGGGTTEYRTSPRTCAHALRHMNEMREKNIDTLLKETFHLKDNEFMSIKRDKTQKEILNCLRMVSQIKKIFFDECSKMINDQIYVLEKNFRIPDCSLSILKNSFGYNDGK